MMYKDGVVVISSYPITRTEIMIDKRSVDRHVCHNRPDTFTCPKSRSRSGADSRVSARHKTVVDARFLKVLKF